MSACVVQALRRAIDAAPPVEPAVQVAAGSLIGRAVTAIRAHPGEPHTLETLADIAGMSRSTFIRHFRRIMRTPPLEYLKRIRLEEARTLLRSTNLPVKTVAAQSGFASRSHFSRLFRAAYGEDPSAFRQHSVDNQLAEAKVVGAQEVQSCA
jgi:AraC family transcriptional regulator, activator of mtrCDE